MENVNHLVRLYLHPKHPAGKIVSDLRGQRNSKVVTKLKT